MDKKHKTIIFDANAMSKYYFPLAVICIILSGLGVHYKHIPFLIVLIPYLCITLVPLLFMNQIQNFFSRSAELEFNNESLTVTEYHLKTGILLNSYSINWSEIKSYQYYDAGKGDIINLKFYFTNGKSKLFKFRGEKIYINKAIEDENSIFRILHSFIKNYNDKSDDHIITFQKFFIIRTGGDILIWSLPIIFIAAFFINFSQGNKASFVWIVLGLVITPMFVALKKRYNAIYSKISALGYK